MKQFRPLVLGFLFSVLAGTVVFAQCAAPKNEVYQKADALQPQLVAWRRAFHTHPELGNHEVQTALIIAKHLQSLGLEVQTGVATTGVVGILKGGKPGPVVALRADMDGLPVTERTPIPFASKDTTTYNGQTVGVMHACGHDTHMAILMGVAQLLAGMKSELHGTVKFIFQPAEEGVPRGEKGGAEEMVKQGVLESPKVDVIFGLHIDAQLEVGKLAYKPGGAWAAVNDFQIIVKGRSSHGAYPWFSVDPIVTAAQIINNLQTIVSRNLNVTENAGVVTIGAIHGGNRSNIIPEQVEMLGTIRSLSAADEQLMTARVRDIATKTADAAGAVAEVTLPYTQRDPVTFNDSNLTAAMLPTLQAVAGTANVRLSPARTGGEDFSFYQQKVPGLYFRLGGMPKGGDPKTTAAHHTPDFYIDESGFALGVKALTALTLDYMKAHSK